MNQAPPTDPEWNRLDFRRRQAPVATPYFPGWIAIALTAVLALATAWLWRGGVEGGAGLGHDALAAGIAVAIFAVAWAAGYGVFRASGRSELVGPITMTLLAVAALAWPFAQAAWLDRGRPEEIGELIGALRASEENGGAVGRQTDAAQAPAEVEAQLQEFDRLAGLRHYAAGAPKQRLAALRAFQQARLAPLIRYQIAFNRINQASEGSFTTLVANLPKLRAATAEFVAASEALRTAWKDVPALLDRQLAAAPFEAAQLRDLRLEYEQDMGVLEAPIVAVADANAQYARVQLETIEFLADKRGQWQERPDGGLLARSQAMLTSFETQRSRTLHARRNSSIAVEALREVEIEVVRRVSPGKQVTRKDDYYQLR
jgi:hypothetical protein